MSALCSLLAACLLACDRAAPARDADTPTEDSLAPADAAPFAPDGPPADATSLDARAPIDATVDTDAAACLSDTACPLAHRCVFGRCLPHPGGTGTPCPIGDECAVDAVCTGSAFPHLGPICVRACASGACPGGYACQWWSRPREDGAVRVATCLPRNAFGTPCANQDGIVQCTREGESCQGPSPEVTPSYDQGLCLPGAGCSFPDQTGCASDETCHPAGLDGRDNTRATYCERAATGGGGQAEPCPCRPGFRCVQLSSRHSICLKYCTPGHATHGCAGVPALSPEIACNTGAHNPLLCPDGGAATDAGASSDGAVPEARCYDLYGSNSMAANSVPAGVCR